MIMLKPYTHTQMCLKVWLKPDLTCDTMVDRITASEACLVISVEKVMTLVLTPRMRVGWVYTRWIEDRFMAEIVGA